MKEIDNDDGSPPADLYFGNIIGAFSRALSDKMDRAVRKAAGLSSSACYTIVTVGTEPYSSIETLRRMLGLEHSSLVRLIDRMQKQGLLRRIRGIGKDLREVKVTLTERGEDCFSKILTARREVLENAMRSLTCEDRERISAMIHKMMPNVVDGGDDQHYVCRLCDIDACPQENCPVNLAYPELIELPEKRPKELRQCSVN